ncbi:MAG TPA: response regulator, partial [Nitrospiria bacterium]
MKPRHSILIADDEAGPREALNLILKPFFGVYHAENGTEAVNLIRSRHIDLVILDLNMPGLKGTDVLREIKKIKPRVEVIILTGQGSMKTAVEALRLGASDYILKPFNIAEMMGIVNRTLSKKGHLDRLNEFLTRLEYVFGKQSSVGDIRDGLANDPGLLDSFREILTGTAGVGSEQENGLSLEFVRLLVDTLDAKDPYTVGHSNRVNYYSSLLAQGFKLDPDEQRDLQTGAYLHDIGNLGIDVRTL